MIKYDNKEVEVQEVDGQTATVRRKDGVVFNSGFTVKVVPIGTLSDDKNGLELEDTLRKIRVKQQHESYERKG